ncbi:uncharacterized protein LOC113554652 [Rhopalosiphum maidis]|uniref:uncharacterized protein LOC113554652 n=1 Tax=Rhopalosiphum maidis TaxID=43146 RepID=UPI000EFE2C17|nr:uncharacterized protein LOC113554652 [Rhopalosiphum maidis]
MFVLSHSVISVFTLTVLLNVFYIVPTQSLHSSSAFKTCQECIASACHKDSDLPCVPCDDGVSTLCIRCDKKTMDGDQQFYSQQDCEKSCADKAKCTCDGSCYVCVEKGNAPSMTCDELSKAYDESCNLIPYTPK